MSIFDKFRADAASTGGYQPESEQEAWVALLISCMLIDNHMSNQEIELLSRALARKQMFQDKSLPDLFKRARYFYGETGAKGLIEIAAQHVSPEYRKTLYCIACDILLADGILNDEENELFTYLAGALHLSGEDFHQILEVTLCRNKGNVVFTD